MILFHRLLTGAAWALLAFIVYATVSPIQDRPTLPTPASFEHIAAFAALGVLFCLAYPRHIALVCVLVIGSAVILEMMQVLTADRHGRIPDAVEKMVGGALGILGGRIIVAIDHAGRWFQN